MKIFIVLVIALFTSGCATFGVIQQRAAMLNDEAIDGAIFTICYAASVGSVRRKFNSPDAIKRYNELCKGLDNSVLISTQN